MDSLGQLLALAQSPDPLDRAAAGQGLVGHIGDPRADVALVSLIGDAEDTLPTFDTSAALVTRGDDAAFRILALALGTADQDSVSHSLDALAGAAQSQPDADALRARLHVVVSDPDADVRRGAAILLGWFDRP